MAARMGDPDPDKNPRLRLAIREARAHSLPKDVIERAIKRSQSVDGTTLVEVIYEGYGAGGVAIVVEAMTDNRNRTASSVRSIFGKNGGSLGEAGSVMFMFARKGLIEYSVSACSAERMLEAAVEAGAEDVQSSDDGHLVWCADSDLGDVAGALEPVLGEAASARLEWRPDNNVALDVEQMQSLLRLTDALEDDDDVQRVTTNATADDDVLARLAAS